MKTETTPPALPSTYRWVGVDEVLGIHDQVLTDGHGWRKIDFTQYGQPVNAPYKFRRLKAQEFPFPWRMLWFGALGVSILAIGLTVVLHCILKLLANQ